MLQVRLKELRERAGFSQAVLAKKLELRNPQQGCGKVVEISLKIQK